MVWLVLRAVKWVATFYAATIAVRVATALIAWYRPRAVSERRRRDGRWIFGWLVLLAVSLAIIHCQLGDYYSFVDPLGGEWNFDGHGWPLTERNSISARSSVGPSTEAIYWVAIAVDLLFSLLLLAATRIDLDRWITAWDSPKRWSMLGRNAAGWCAALLVVLVCERLAMRPPTLPGTDLIVYSTLLHEPADVRAGMLIGLASTAHLFGLGVVCGARTLKHWREDGLV